MCGIAGYVTNTATNYRHAVAVAVMAQHMETRGKHAWGCMGDAETIHGLGAISLGLTVSDKLPQRLALHTRYGTTGANTLANAHPFTVAGTAGTVTGMHNGIIDNHRELNQRHARECAVDSQHIFHALANGKSLNELSGYGTIVYSLNDVWHIGRFNNGEVAIAQTSEGVFFASTKDAVLEALTLAGVTITKWLKVRNNTVYRLTAKGVKRVYTIDAGETLLRWNDALERDWLDDFKGSKKSLADLSYCDTCGERGELYEHETNLVCADCYYVLTNTVPGDYIEDATFYGSRFTD